MELWMGGAENIKRPTIDKEMSAQQRTQKWGYEYNEHDVTTEDGYNLKLIQISKPGLSTDAPAVLLQHGLSSSSNTWVRNGEYSPAFMLAKEGFNVFLGNNRGNKFSRTH